MAAHWGQHLDSIDLWTTPSYIGAILVSSMEIIIKSGDLIIIIQTPPILLVIYINDQRKPINAVILSS